jgi:hypothetical protein
MIYVKATAVGIVSGVILAIVWMLAAVSVPILSGMFLASLKNEGGVAASYVDSRSALLAAFIGFVAGFFWTVRRARRPQSSKPMP